MNYQELQEDLFAFAYGSALHDAVNQQAFQGKEIPLRKNKEAQIIVKEYIDDLLKGNNPDFYGTAEKIESVFTTFIKDNYNDVLCCQKKTAGNPATPKFRFGNAQKLINMTVKNMYVLAYADEGIRDKFSKCHCPMDNVMIAYMQERLSKLKNEGNQEAAVLLDQWRACGKTAWSRIERPDITKYNKFQEIIRFLAEKEGMSPIEYDYKMWG